MSTVAFIGLGIMGAPMAANLVRAGHDVIGVDRSAEALERHRAAGGRTAADIAGAVADADVIITMLPDSPDVEGVALPPGGLLEQARQGALYLDMSSVRPQTAQAVATRAAELGVGFCDAPVSGGEPGAVEASLSIMVGGAKDDFERALPLLQAMGRTIQHVGPAGAGQTTKAANQLLVGGIISLVGEAMVLLQASAVDLEPALTVLRGGLAGNQVLERKWRSMLDHDFAPGFKIDLHHKDYGIVTAAARDAGVALPVTGLVSQLMAAARAQGLGGSDHSALLTLTEALSGVRVGDPHD